MSERNGRKILVGLLLLGHAGAVVDAVVSHWTLRTIVRIPSPPPALILLVGLVQALAAVGTFLLCAPHARRLWQKLRADVPLAALLALTALSALWSWDPWSTLAAALRAFAVVALAAYLAERSSRHEQMEIFHWTWLVLLAVSLVLAVATPYGISTDEAHDGSWCGALANRNQLGAVAGLGLLLFTVGGRTAALWMRGSGLVLAGLLLVHSGARSGYVAVAVAVVVVAVSARREGPAHQRSWPALGAMLAAGVVLTLVLSATDAVSSLHGRLRVWRQVLSAARAAPWLGHGYGVFWASNEALSIQQALFRPVSEAHNALVQLWLELGIGAVILMLMHFGRTLFALRGAPSDDPWRRWTLAVLTFWGARNLVEVAALTQYGGDTLIWIPYLVESFRLRSAAPATEIRPHV